MVERSDNELITLTLAGDDDSFSLLVERHKDFVYTMTVRILKNEQLAEEVAQDSFLRAYKSLKTFRHQSKFSTWLYRICYNLSLNALAKENRSRTLFSDRDIEETQSVQNISDETDSPLRYTDNRDLSNIVNECIDELPTKYGSILSMYHLSQLKYEEISIVTGLPIGTVKSHLYRGRNLLKKLINDRYDKSELI
ncbi:MAG: sigma-70 family RNA polymerase sigma factor [Candidatus Marinimicrobia bacterium]|nr:sigma-70 family RNA polymerase sigma factor [Candidatus Neomarinimicrobiota bacterium]